MGNVSQATKNACPKCGVKFRAGALLPMHELQRLQKAGVVNLDEPPERMPCPKCGVPLKVVSVRMGTFFQVE
jgi:predicted RNA-binding Zn-ribbon protein involved in translation (DUF1610 family)